MNWPFHRAVPRYDHAASLATVNAMLTQAPSPASIPAVQPATTTAVPESDMSFLSNVGKDFKAVFAFLGSSKGQAVISAVETTAELATGGAITGAVNLINSWMGEAIKLEALGVAAAATTGSSTTKAAAVISTMTPQVLSWAAANGYPVPNATQIQAINDSVVNTLTLLGAPATPATTAAVPAPAAA